MCKYSSSSSIKKLAVIAVLLLFAAACSAQAIEKAIFTFMAALTGGRRRPTWFKTAKATYTEQLFQAESGLMEPCLS